MIFNFTLTCTPHQQAQAIRLYNAAVVSLFTYDDDNQYTTVYMEACTFAYDEVNSMTLDEIDEWCAMLNNGYTMTIDCHWYTGIPSISLY